MQDRSAGYFLKRLSIFFSIICLCSITLIPIARTGEVIPVGLVAWAQTWGKPFIFLPKYSNHAYKLKLDAANLIQPEVLVLGTSRSNQWRSKMFAPMTFYNAGNAIFPVSDLTEFLKSLNYTPKVIIFSIDDFIFSDHWAKSLGTISHKDLYSPVEIFAIAKQVAMAMLREPASLFRPHADPIYNVPALGLGAIENGDGFRIDGSMQYGSIYTNRRQSFTLAQALERMETGEQPFVRGESPDFVQMNDFKEFTALARSKGISLIGVTMPFAPELLDEMAQKERSGLSLAFQKPAFAEWIRQQGVIYFNYLDISTFGGRADEFVDVVHPSETAYLRMLLQMLRDPAARRAFASIDESALRQRLGSSTRFEVFRNEF